MCGATQTRSGARADRGENRITKSCSGGGCGISYAKDVRGAAAAELPFPLPVLLILLFGIIQFGFIFFVWNDMTNAAREGARRLAVDGSLTEEQARTIVETWLGAWPGTTFTITACKTAEDTADPATCIGDDEVFVRVTAPMAEVAVIGNFVDWIGANTLTAQVVMRSET